MSIGVVIFGLALIVGISYLVLLFVLMLGWNRAGKLANTIHFSQTDTSLSIVVPIKNEAHNIASLLAAISQQNYNLQQIEVVLVDDHSEDNSFQVINDIGIEKAYGFSIKQIRLAEDKGGKKAAVRMGVLHAAYELIVQTDADCIPGKNWLASLVSFYEKKQAVLVSAPVLSLYNSSFFSTFQAIEHLSLMASGGACLSMRLPLSCSAANMAYNKTAYLGIPEEELKPKVLSGDDVFLLFALFKRFPKQVFFINQPEASVKTTPPHKATSFIKQRIRWAGKLNHYNNVFPLFSATTVYLMSVLIIATGILSLFMPAFFWAFFGLLITKLLPDFVFLCLVSSKYKMKKLLIWYPLFAIIYIPYIAITGFLSITNKGSSW